MDKFWIDFLLGITPNLSTMNFKDIQRLIHMVVMYRNVDDSLMPIGYAMSHHYFSKTP
jgi:hypothetical protein